MILDSLLMIYRFKLYYNKRLVVYKAVNIYLKLQHYIALKFRYKKNLLSEVVYNTKTTPVKRML